MAQQLEVRFGLSSERSREIAKVAHQFNKLAGSRELTEKDADIFSVAVIGKSIKDVERAVKESVQGNSENFKVMLDEIAKHNKTSPEKINQIISEVFF